MAEFYGSRLVTVASADHGKMVVDALGNLFDSKRGVDFDFRWGNKSVRAHRLILELFLAPRLICSSPDVEHVRSIKQEITDGDNESGNYLLDSLLEFLYKGEVAVPEGQLENLLAVAIELEFHILVDAVTACRNMSDEYVDCLTPKDTPGCSGIIKIEKGSFESLSENLSCENVSDESIRGEEGSFEIDIDNANCAFENISETEKDPVTEVNSDVNDGDATEGENPYTAGGSAVGKSASHINVKFPKSIKGVSGLELLKCRSCDFETSDPEVRRRHVLAVHISTARSVPDSTPVEKSKLVSRPASRLRRIIHHKCTKCDFTTIKWRNLKAHEQSTHLNGIHVCPYCIFVSKQKVRLEAHLKTDHGKCNLPFTCEICDKRFQVKSRLKKHQEIHENERHKCPHCGQGLKTKSYMQQHILNMHAHLLQPGMLVAAPVDRKRPFKCPFCQSQFVDVATLKVHVLVSHDRSQSQFMCQTCAHLCTSRSDLVQHNLTHTSEVYKCTHCSYTAARKWLLDVHVTSVHGAGSRNLSASTTAK